MLFCLGISSFNRQKNDHRKDIFGKSIQRAPASGGAVPVAVGSAPLKGNTFAYTDGGNKPQNNQKTFQHPSSVFNFPNWIFFCYIRCATAVVVVALCFHSFFQLVVDICKYECSSGGRAIITKILHTQIIPK